jgi:beta-glucosidase
MTSSSILPAEVTVEAPSLARLRFGVATAAYQVEGAASADGRGPSIWDAFCRVPGAVAGGDTGDVACDHYHRWERDLDLMAELNVEAYRFSIAWSRVQPDGAGALNPKGVAFYRRLLEGCHERGIEPVVTLYHWDLPQALHERGGWAARDTAGRFADYAEAMATELGGLTRSWITLNEPWVVAFLGYAEGRKAPGIRDWPTALRVSHHLLRAHGLAAQALRAQASGDPEVGITLNLHPVRPASDSAADARAARLLDGYHNRWFLDPLLCGSYPEDVAAALGPDFGWPECVHDGDLATIAQPLDFLGVNYYFPHRAAADPAAAPFGVRTEAPRPPLTSMGWEQDPAAFGDLLLRLRSDYGDLPISITENGAAFGGDEVVDGRVHDPERVAYLRGHLAALGRAMADGVDVRRYFAWSLLDNFEWEHGYRQRFGIVHVDYETQQRTPKDSALWYRDLIAAVRAADGS